MAKDVEMTTKIFIIGYLFGLLNYTADRCE